VITDSRLGPSVSDYQAAFTLERMQLYPMVSEFEDGPAMRWIVSGWKAQRVCWPVR